MIAKVINLKNTHLDIHKIERKQLSIQFSLDGFSFLIFDLDLQKYIVLSAFEFNVRNNNSDDLLDQIKQIFLKEEILHQKFDKIIVIHVNNLSTFVPYPLFDEDYLETYIKFNNKVYSSDFFEYDLVANHDMVSVFVPYVHVNNFLIDQFGSFEYKHYSSVLVERLLNNYANRSNVSFFINVSKSHFEIIVSKQQNLLLYNTFSYTTSEDFLYYILFTIEQLKLNVETVDIKLFGNIDKEKDLYLKLYNYVRNISLLKFKTKYNATLGIDDVLMSTYFCLFNTTD